MKSRIAVLSLIFLLFAAAVTVRLFTLQVLSHEFYQGLADNQHGLYKTLMPTRGEIYIYRGTNGDLEAVVTNIEKNLVYAVPSEISDKKKTAATLGKILEMKSEEIYEKISDENRKWVALKKQLPESVSLQIEKFDLDGIHLQPETYRYYPEQVFASQILGFYGYQGDKRVGQYGIEEYYEDILSGSAGSLETEKDSKGRWIVGATRELNPAQDGADIVLTLDRAIQFKAEELLKKTVDQYQAESGSVVIMDPKTGAIQAMADYPSFDPNTFNEVEDPQVYRNHAVSDAYEPGSVFKAITMAAGLNAELITPDMTYQDTGAVAVDDYVIRNFDNKARGEQTMTQVLQFSLNTGVIFVEDVIGPEIFLDIVKKFGFGESTGLTLPTESGGNISNLAGGGDVNYATASFGQGITVTPIQLAQAYSTIANQGKMMKPYIVDSIKYADGREDKINPEIIREVISSKAANILSAMLVSVVEEGQAKRAIVPGYYIAGKTGTAQVARTDGRGYDPDKTIGTFTGFGPADDPKFVIVVKITNPKGVSFASSVATPLFGEIAQYLVDYYQIPPSR